MTLIEVASTTTQSFRPWINQLALGLVLALLAISGILGAALTWCVSGDFYWTVALAGALGNATFGLVANALVFLALRKRKRIFIASLVLVFLAQSIATITCTEFTLQRGAPIAPIDIVNGFDWGFIESQIGVLYSLHFGPFLALSVLVLVGGLVAVGCLRTATTHREVAIVLAVLSGFLILSFVVHGTRRGGHALRPYNRLLGALTTTNHLNIIVGLESALREASISDRAVEPGLAMLGLGTERCADGLHVVEHLGDQGRSTPSFFSSFRSLSEEVHASGRPLSFILVVLESVGAEDIHALGGTAPQGLTPYMDQLSEGGGHVLVGRRFFQGGQRTAGAMSALLCGMGAAPFGLAPLRDLPHLKLRCWSDLAAEAGADLRFFYADNLAFDRYDGSLLDHGFRYLYEARVQGRPKGAWGLSDRELFKDILADLKETSAGVSQQAARIRGVLTLSTHGPFEPPEDMPADALSRAQSLARGATEHRTKQAHWVTVSYVDEALSRFVPDFMRAELSAGRFPVVLIVGDHTSGVSVSQQPLDVARIAPFWIFPQSIDPRRTEPVQRALDARNYSQNDLSRMLLILLDGAGVLRTLPEQSRWHNLGGQALSVSFSVLPPWQETRLWSIDTLARARFLGPSNEILVEEVAESPSTREHLNGSVKATDKALPAFSWMLQHPERMGPCRP